jgi:arsenite oxidase small subunit
MSRCSKLVDMGRRQFLRGSTYAAAGAAVAVSMPGETRAAASGQQWGGQIKRR